MTGAELKLTGSDATVSSLGRPLNTSGEDLDFFVSRDESFMIATNRPRISHKFSEIMMATGQIRKILVVK